MKPPSIGFLLTCSVFSVLFSSSFACNGYEVVVDVPKVCGGSSDLLSVTNLTVTLNDQCQVFGNISFKTSGFSSAKV